MRKSLPLLTGALMCLFTSYTYAQSKYALLIGVNDYYLQPGVKSTLSLKGCVNDAVSMKNLLIDRFAFEPGNILTLYNTQATKKSILDGLKTMLSKCKPGDALVFFFSGHGVWIDNKATINDPVKRGLSQAIVTSDLFAEKWECLVRDAMLKKYFNEFVDRKVKVTSIFDCCYAGNMIMPPLPFGENQYAMRIPVDVSKSLGFGTLKYIPKVIPPTGCGVNNDRHARDTVDSDRDGIPDCADYEIYTPMVCFPVDSIGVGMCEPEALAFLPDDSLELSEPEVNSNAARSFNLVDVITIADSVIIPRPSERPNSAFLSISGTSDTQKGLEITDELGRRHGAFTKALLSVYRENAATISVDELLKKVSALMKKQRYAQNVIAHYDPARLNENLIGTDHGRLTPLTAKCLDEKSGLIVLDKGINSGIAKGNILVHSDSAGKIRIQVVSQDENTSSATAIDLRVTKIQKGSEFVLSDPYTISTPIIKIYVGNPKLNAAHFETLFNTKVKPLVNLPNYRDYNLWTNASPTINIFFNEFKPINDHTARLLLHSVNKSFFHVFLPIPENIAGACIQTLKKDQNVEIVTDINKAQYVLYLNYAKPRDGKKAEFVLTLCEPITREINDLGSRHFFPNNVKVANINLKNDELARLTASLNQSVREVIRGITTRWMNDYRSK